MEQAVIEGVVTREELKFGPSLSDSSAWLYLIWFFQRDIIGRIFKRDKIHQIALLKPSLILHICSNTLDWCEVTEIAILCKSGGESAL